MGPSLLLRGFRFLTALGGRDPSSVIAVLTEALTTQIANPACVSKVMGQFASQILGFPFPGQPRAVWGTSSLSISVLTKALTTQLKSRIQLLLI
jgi:hypothetical protein